MVILPLIFSKLRAKIYNVFCKNKIFFSPNYFFKLCRFGVQAFAREMSGRLIMIEKFQPKGRALNFFAQAKRYSNKV